MVTLLLQFTLADDFKNAGIRSAGNQSSRSNCSFFWIRRLYSQLGLVQQTFWFIRTNFFCQCFQKLKKVKSYLMTGWRLLMCGGSSLWSLSETSPQTPSPPIPSPPLQHSLQQRPQALMCPSCNQHCVPLWCLSSLCPGSWCSIMLKISFMGERNHILYTSKATKKDLIITENERIIWQLNYFCIKSLSNNKINVETHTFCSSYPLFTGVMLTFPLFPCILKSVALDS